VIKKRTSILYFTYLQLAILGLFAFVTIFTLTRLANVQQSFERLTVETLPTIIDGATVNNSIERLLFLTVSLSNATNMPTSRIVSQQLDDTFASLRELLNNDKAQQSFISTQVTSLEQELKELGALVEQRLKIQNNLSDNKIAFFSYVQQLYDSSQNTSEAALLTRIALSAVNLAQYDRIYQLRSIEQTFSAHFEALDKLRLPEDRQRHLNTLYSMLNGESGIIYQQIESLRVTGRTIGRGNFVRNLVNDVANSLSLKLTKGYEGLQHDAEKTESRIEEQFNTALIAGSITLLLTLFMIFLLYKRIVWRLIKLNKQVDHAAKLDSYNSISEVTIDGEDEIAELADTFSMYIHKVKEQEEALLSMSLTDSLTGVPNRRAFDEKISTEIASASRQNWPLTLLLIDIDFFKRYNDYYGHAKGDNCLTLVAETLNKHMVRRTDLFARFGGEEFVCVLPNTDSDGAKIKAEQLLNAISALQIEHKNNTDIGYVTISIGVATFSYSKHKLWSYDRIIEQTDLALYQAKDAGRNCFRHIDITGD
jgi:diguanylate cyclase (GGDEF)-like protein